MKIFTFILVLVFITLPAFADQWCEWNGETGVNCQSASVTGGLVIDGRPTRTISLAHAAGWYKLIVTQPTIGTDQTSDLEVWGFANNEISKTWTVRDLTTEELDQRVASPMPLNTYYLWKALIVKGVITQAEAVTALPQELIDAYQARDRLENP